MGDYLKLFETTAEYELFIQTDYDKPNVSYCEDNNEVHYNPWTKPNNIIRYEASEKLTETTSDKSNGLHTNKFNTTIISHTFENGVGTIEFEDDVTSIGDYAFYGCTNLTNIIIPNSVTSIGLSAFYGCSGLTSVTIPSTVTSIGGSVFYNCFGLRSATIGGGVTTIGNSAFKYCGLRSVTIESTTPPTLGSNAFYDSNNCPIYVLSTSVETYKTASGWSEYADRIQAIPTT